MSVAAGRQDGPRDAGLLENVDAGERWKAARPRRGARWRRVVLGIRPEPQPSFLGTVEEPAPGRSGICCSGGGIRSAAFNLGALQALQRNGELRRATYLAAVSGGSYIAAAFSMVAKCWPSEHAGRPRPGDAGHDDSDPRLIKRCEPFAPGSPEEQYLRNRSSYLAPDGAGKLYLAGRIVLGLLFNVVLICLPLAGATLLLSELLYGAYFPGLPGDCETAGAADCARWAMHVPPLSWLTPAFVGVAGDRLRPDEDAGQVDERRHAALLGDVVHAPAAARRRARRPAARDSDAHRAGALGLEDADRAGGAQDGRRRRRDSRSSRGSPASPRASSPPSGRSSRYPRWLKRTSSRLRRKCRLGLAYLAAAVAGPLLLVTVVVAMACIALSASARGLGEEIVAIGLGAFVLCALLYAVTDITSLSLHPFYKRRLCTAFALKRIRPADLDTAERDRQQAVQAGPGQDVGISVERDFDELVTLSDTALGEDGTWPTLLVCAAANISDPGATPPGRKVTSFTFSARTIGGPLVGAHRRRPTRRSSADAARGDTAPGPRSQPADGGGHLGRRPRPVDGQAQPPRADVPAGTRQHQARGVGAEPALGRRAPRPQAGIAGATAARARCTSSGSCSAATGSTGAISTSATAGTTRTSGSSSSCGAAARRCTASTQAVANRSRSSATRSRSLAASSASRSRSIPPSSTRSGRAATRSGPRATRRRERSPTGVASAARSCTRGPCSRPMCRGTSRHTTRPTPVPAQPDERPALHRPEVRGLPRAGLPRRQACGRPDARRSVVEGRLTIASPRASAPDDGARGERRCGTPASRRCAFAMMDGMLDRALAQRIANAVARGTGSAAAAASRTCRAISSRSAPTLSCAS